MVKVTNISGTLRVLYDKGGKRVEIEPGMSVDMVHPPEEHYAFKIGKLDNIEKKEKRKEEHKAERRNE